ncbi:ketoacyl-ACP synthase III [Helicobacter jaachi]|uniref:Ketoacyl-ACP synthase III n=1 Tax=Helicobacter jaachi TaxID=1677920 RepID=A0A4U8T9J1_9HELI|nr:ketoacyl-ACP synthase III [Helicobacter jaachi]TLD96490.1 ketoacyl-ACP synthase III [Helicobacter jaachi]
MNATIEHARICHIATMLPSKRVQNALNPNFSERDKRKIIKTTGIQTRYELQRDYGNANDETLLDLYAPCAKACLEALKWELDSIDGLIVVSQQHEYKLPATACLLQEHLGLSSECFAYDIAMGCSGYVYGLYAAMSHINGGGARRILLFVGDAPSNITYHKDKSAALLFSDVGSCTALEYSQEAMRAHFRFSTIGSGFANIIAPFGGLKHPLTEQSFSEFIDSNGNANTQACQQINGIEVFDFTIKHLPPNIQKLLDYAHLSLEDIEKCYFHQANKMINDYLSAKLNIAHKAPLHIEHFGNASSASIPLLLCDNKQGRISDKTALLAGFGVGLSVGLVIVQNLECTTSLLYRVKEHIKHEEVR